MHVALRKRAQGDLDFGVVYGGIVLLALLAGRYLPVLALAPTCVFRTLTGFPCPTCGSTRSIVFLSRGDIYSAVAMNPLVAICALTALVFMLYGLFALVLGMPRVSFALSEKEKDRVRLAVVLLVLINWLYLVSVL